MQIFVKTPSRTLIVYHTVSEDDTILQIKRHVAEKLKLDERHAIYDMMLYVGSLSLNDKDKVQKVLQNDITIFLTYKMYSGPTALPVETEQVWAECGTHDFQKVNVSYSPSHKVLYIIQQVLEYLVSVGKLNNDLTVNDVYLKLGNTILNPRKYTAEYPELATSFIAFNLQDDFINRLSTIGLLIDKFGSYYQLIPLGNRIQTNNKLEFYVGSKKTNIEEDTFECVSCQQKYDMIVPCCRKRSCFTCFENSVCQTKTCCFCNEVIV